MFEIYHGAPDFSFATPREASLSARLSRSLSMRTSPASATAAATTSTAAGGVADSAASISGLSYVDNPYVEPEQQLQSSKSLDTPSRQSRHSQSLLSILSTASEDFGVSFNIAAFDPLANLYEKNSSFMIVPKDAEARDEGSSNFRSFNSDVV
jgi:hypothetical protein